MPLIDIEKQGDSLSNKQMRNLKKYNDLQEGDGLFSGLSNLFHLSNKQMRNLLKQELKLFQMFQQLEKI